MRIEDSAMTGRITVYGSCVARDAASEMENRGWSVERYIARQSLISAGRQPTSETSTCPCWHRHSLVVPSCRTWWETWRHS